MTEAARTVAPFLMLASPAERLAHLVEVIGGHRYRYGDEIELQAAIATAFNRAGIAYEREVRLTARDRIDFLVDDVGIEVKIKGGPSAVLGQLGRYTRSERIAALLLVSDRAQLTRIRPGADGFNGKPFRALALLGGIV